MSRHFDVEPKRNIVQVSLRNAMEQQKVPPVTNPTVDLAEVLSYLVGETGLVQESLGGFKIKVFHARGFPWDEVFKALLYRDFRVHLTRHKADIFIEALP